MLACPRTFGTARAWTVDMLAGEVYSRPSKLGFSHGYKGTEKKHRVAILRALKTMPLPGTWQIGHGYPHDTVVLFDPCDEQSAQHYRLLSEGRHLVDKLMPAEVEYIKQEVALACRYRDGSQAERAAVTQEREAVRRSEDEAYDRQRAAIEADVYGVPDVEQGKHITKQLRVSYEEREILNATLFNGKRLGDVLVESYRAQMSAGWDGKWVEIAGVSLTHYAFNGPDDPAKERTRNAHMGILDPD